MAGHASKKRPIDGRLQRPSKKQKRRQEYHSESESEEDRDVEAVDLLDSDDDIHNARVDDGADEGDSSSSEEEAPKLKRAMKMKTKSKGGKASAQKAPEKDSDDDDSDGDGVSGEKDDSEGDDSEDDSDVDEPDMDLETTEGKPKKRNDPTAFATSLSKILSTKLSSSKRSDPVLSRSAAAHEASKAAVDSALEAKARRQLKEQKRRALEKGRVRDVLLATNNDVTGEPESSTAEILETEKRLRQVAKRGVITMFNAVRAAQVKAAEAEREAKKQGVLGINRREEKVNELSKKGFLELIASGGGGLKKGALEEA